jgi:hypothetical protein
MTLKQNVGTIDQWLRLALGFVLLFLAGTGTIGAWGYIGIVPLVTGAVRFCPLYALLGIRTCPAPSHKAH